MKCYGILYIRSGEVLLTVGIRRLKRQVRFAGPGGVDCHSFFFHTEITDSTESFFRFNIDDNPWIGLLCWKQRFLFGISVLKMHFHKHLKQIKTYHQYEIFIPQRFFL